jgi:protein-disulfide isomerase
MSDSTSAPSDEIETRLVARALRRSRMKQLGAVATLVIAAVAAILITAGDNTASPPAPNSGRAATTAQQVDTLLANIPQEGDSLGRRTAPVTLEWFGDLECPFCRQFTLGALPAIIEKWVRSGLLRIEYHSMETATRDPKVFKAQQIAALAAGEQNKMWYFVELFYQEQGEEDSGYVTERYLRGLASQVQGLDVEQWSADRNNPELAVQVAEDRRTVAGSGFVGTPSFIFDWGHGQRGRFTPSSLTDPRPFNEAIKQVLRE